MFLQTPRLSRIKEDEESQGFLACPSLDQQPLQSCADDSRIFLGICFPTNNCHFLGSLPGVHFKGYNEHGIRPLAREPQQISPFWGQTAADIQPAVPTQQSKKGRQVSEKLLKAMAACVVVGMGRNLQVLSSFETSLWAPSGARALKSQGPSKDGDCRCLRHTRGSGMWL